MRSAPIDPPSPPFGSDAFDDFYADALPVVFGYLVKLCGGDREKAWDLTQDVWVSVVDRLNEGATDVANVPYVVTLARSKFIDGWRREKRLQRKLQLVWSAEREVDDNSPPTGATFDHLETCSPTSRLLLMLAYIEEVPVVEIADLIGKPVSTTYSLLARARSELRDRMTGGGR